MNHESHISRLIYRRLIGTITPDEDARLNRWLDESNDNRRFYDTLADRRALADEHRTYTMIDPLRPAIDMERRIASRHRQNRTRRASGIAAAVIVLLALGGALWHFNSRPPLPADPGKTPVTAAATTPLTIDDITAGTTRATVTNASGQAIALTAGESGLDATSHFITAASASPEQLCLEVPRGGEFKVLLEDSTEVWLNSESTLRYPDTFSDTERRVAVSGEAYFRVRRDTARPFYVETDGQIIRVHGTSFNIRAYADEPATYTTLESGSISLSRAGNTSSGEIFMSKGHQAVFDHESDRVNMTVVDPAIVTSWRHGRFVFEDQPLDRIMRDLSRWYDFRYEFAEPELGRQIFMGSIPRYSDFRTAIRILENCGDIRFTITPDNSILISKN